MFFPYRKDLFLNKDHISFGCLQQLESSSLLSCLAAARRLVVVLEPSALKPDWSMLVRGLCGVTLGRAGGRTKKVVGDDLPFPNENCKGLASGPCGPRDHVFFLKRG